MKNTNIISFTIYVSLLICFAYSMVFAQNSSADYQSFLAKTQTLFNKDVETFNKEDISQLNEVINMDINRFGEENARLSRNLIEQAKKKKIEYDQYIARMKKMSATLDTLDNEKARRVGVENENAELMLENKNLKHTIDELKTIITRLENQESKMRNANARLEKENLAANNLLKESRIEDS